MAEEDGIQIAVKEKQPELVEHLHRSSRHESWPMLICLLVNRALEKTS